MKKWLFGSLILCFLMSLAGCSSTGVDTAANQKFEDVLVAYSLQVLQQSLQANPQESRQATDITHLAGINRIQGYLIDETNHDLILFGYRDANLPPLYLDDLVVALRNAMHKYTTRQGDTIYYTNPGCSIDPDPQVLSRLDEVSRRINQLTSQRASREAVNRELQNWHQTCRGPQAVRVLGIPFDTRFAWVMVKADYDMKQLVDGSDTPEIEGFRSLTGMTMDLAKQDIIAGQPISVPLASMNRFWFHPGENLYVEDEGVVEITQCPVILLTEEEHLTKAQKIVGKGAPNPLAQQFTESFSGYYQEIARKRPIFAQLEGLFRFVALAKIIQFKGADQAAGLDLSYLLEHYEVPQVRVSKMLPGRSHIPEFEHRQDFQDGHRVVQLWLPSCGGVGIEMKITQKLFFADTDGVLQNVRNVVIESRPSPQTLFWEIPSARPDRVRLEKNELRLAANTSWNQGSPNRQ